MAAVGVETNVWLVVMFLSNIPQNSGLSSSTTTSCITSNSQLLVFVHVHIHVPA